MKKWGRLLMVLLAVMVLGGVIPETAKAAETWRTTISYTFFSGGEDLAEKSYEVIISNVKCKLCGGACDIQWASLGEMQYAGSFRVSVGGMGIGTKCTACKMEQVNSPGRSHSFSKQESGEQTATVNDANMSVRFKVTIRGVHSSTGDNVATCTTAAVCDNCKQSYGDPLGHTLTHVEAKAATCVETGNDEYWYCTVCGKYFKDANGTTETTLADVTLAKDPDAHKWGDLDGWEWDEDGTHRRKCKNGCNTVDECNEALTCTGYGLNLHLYLCDAGHEQIMGCSGGTATCKAAAVCQYCHESYGERNFNNHVSEEKGWSPSPDGENHFQVWSCCGKTVTDGLKARHSGGKPTCTDDGFCEYCGYNYLDPLGHTLTHVDAKAATCVETGNDEYWYCTVCEKYFKDANGATETTLADVTLAKDPEAHNWDGYSSDDNWEWDEDGKHRFKCQNGCGTVLYECETKDTKPYSGDVHVWLCPTGHHKYMPCTGGTATCKNQAECQYCGQSYGKLDSTNHEGTLGDWQTDEANTKHWKAYSCCGVTVEEAAHTGGTATCTEQATCETCGKPYGDLAPTSHTGKKVWKTNDDNTEHWQEWNCCGTMVENTKAAHTGGEATCQNQAVCETCGKPYGTLTNHDYTAVVTTPTCLEKGFTTYTCTICGDNYVSDITSATGHWYGLWSLDQQHAHTATCRNAGCTYTAATACTQYEVTVDENGTLAAVCPVCGEFGEALFELLEDASIKAVGKTALPKGEAILRGKEAPFDGVLYAFTAAYEFAGEVQPFEHAVSISLKLDDTLTAFRLVRVDVTPATVDGERTEVWTELEFTLEDGVLTFETEHEGLFLLLPVA